MIATPRMFFNVFINSSYRRPACPCRLRSTRHRGMVYSTAFSSWRLLYFYALFAPHSVLTRTPIVNHVVQLDDVTGTCSPPASIIYLSAVRCAARLNATTVMAVDTNRHQLWRHMNTLNGERAVDCLVSSMCILFRRLLSSSTPRIESVRNGPRQL